MTFMTRMHACAEAHDLVFWNSENQSRFLWSVPGSTLAPRVIDPTVRECARRRRMKKRISVAQDVAFILGVAAMVSTISYFLF